MLLPAALEKLKNEGYDKLFRNLTNVPLSRKDRAQLKAHDRLTTKKFDSFPHALTAPLPRVTAGSSCLV